MSFQIINQQYSINSMIMIKNAAAVIAALWESQKLNLKTINHRFKTLMRDN